MRISNQITIGEYRKLSLLLFYRRPTIIILSFLGLFGLGAVILDVFFGISIDKDLSIASALAIMAIVFPLIIFYKSGSNYRTSKLLGRELVYEFLPDKLIRETHYGTTSIEWTEFYNFFELKSWFIFYLSEREILPVSKSSMTNDEINHVRMILQHFRVEKYGQKSRK